MLVAYVYITGTGWLALLGLDAALCGFLGVLIAERGGVSAWLGGMARIHPRTDWSAAIPMRPGSSRRCPPAKLAKIMGTSIAQLDDTYHHLMPTDDEFGAAVDTYGAALNG
jgi:hypothetical protein